MGKNKTLDLGHNVIPLNEQAKTYHKALEAAQDDLYTIFCLDLWADPVLATREASEAFTARFRGKFQFVIVPIDPVMASSMFDTFLVAADIAEIEAR